MAYDWCSTTVSADEPVPDNCRPSQATMTNLFADIRYARASRINAIVVLGR
jgi:hypothetical protein